MSHVDTGTLQAWIDGELAEAGLAEVREHVADCATCAAELRSLREADELVHANLAAMPGHRIADFASLAEIRRRARGGSARRLVPSSLARAAILLLALAGVVTAALPQSPLRRWIEAVLADDPTPPVAPRIEPVPIPPVEPVQETGRAVPLDAGRLTIRLIAPAPDVEIHLRIVDDTEASVLWNALDADARTRQGSGTLEIHGLERSPVTIRIPRHARDARVEVDGVIWWRKQGSDIRIPGPAHEQTDDGVVFSPRS